LACISRAV
jgi:hypothetical protein